jgi:hypothetical protein
MVVGAALHFFDTDGYPHRFRGDFRARAVLISAILTCSSASDIPKVERPSRPPMLERANLC